MGKTIKGDQLWINQIIKLASFELTMSDKYQSILW